MATIGEEYVTIVDLAKQLDTKGEGIAPSVMLLAQSNPILDDMPVSECNMTAAHRVFHTTKLPKSYWRAINQGTDVSKSEHEQKDEPTGQLVGRAQVDRTAIELNGNSKAWLLAREREQIESMNQEMARVLLYGNKADDPNAFVGLAPRYSTMDPGDFGLPSNVIDAGGTASSDGLTSAYLVHWGPQTVHGIYPKGLPTGIRRDAEENADLIDRDGREFKGFKSRWEWTIGLAVEDPRYIVRVANIDVAGVESMVNDGAAASAQQKLLRVMLKAHKLIPSGAIGRPVWYVPRNVGLMMDIIAMEKSNVNLTVQTVEGGSGSVQDGGPKRTVTTFYGTPVKYLDAFREDEALVS